MIDVTSPTLWFFLWMAVAWCMIQDLRHFRDEQKEQDQG